MKGRKERNKNINEKKYGRKRRQEKQSRNKGK